MIMIITSVGARGDTGENYFQQPQEPRTTTVQQGLPPIPAFIPNPHLDSNRLTIAPPLSLSPTLNVTRTLMLIVIVTLTRTPTV